jgi:hypothetical protein
LGFKQALGFHAFAKTLRQAGAKPEAQCLKYVAACAGFSQMSAHKTIRVIRGYVFFGRGVPGNKARSLQFGPFSGLLDGICPLDRRALAGTFAAFIGAECTEYQASEVEGCPKNNDRSKDLL